MRSGGLSRMARVLLSCLLRLVTVPSRFINEFRKRVARLRLRRARYLPRSRTGDFRTAYRQFVGKHVSLAALISPAEVRPSLEFVNQGGSPCFHRRTMRRVAFFGPRRAHDAFNIPVDKAPGKIELRAYLALVEYGGRSSMVELQIVVLAVAGSSPVGHPIPFQRQKHSERHINKGSSGD
jgi:hypothetical protein